MWEARERKKARMAPRFLSGCWADSRAIYNTRRRAAVHRRKDSDILNMWRAMGLGESR